MPARARQREPHTAPSDASLVERCRRGDTAAFNVLVERHQQRVLNIAHRIVHDADTAHDLAQEAFVSAYRNLSRFRGNAAFSTWLHRIAYNVCMDEVARRARAAQRSLDTFYGDDRGDGEAGLDVADPASTPDEAVLREERRKAVLNAIASLPENHRTVLTLCDIEGLPYDAMAAMLECPMGTVKSRISRARAALLDALGPCLELFDDLAGQTISNDLQEGRGR